MPETSSNFEPIYEPGKIGIIKDFVVENFPKKLSARMKKLIDKSVSANISPEFIRNLGDSSKLSLEEKTNAERLFEKVKAPSGKEAYVLAYLLDSTLDHLWWKGSKTNTELITAAKDFLVTLFESYISENK